MHSDGQGLALTDTIRGAAKPLRTPADLDPLLERIGDARFVLLGEASHGTSEFYRWRSGDHAAARSRSRLLVRRRRRRLARLLPRQPVREAAARVGRERGAGAARVRALADVDVGEPRGRRARRMAARAQRAALVGPRRSASTASTCTRCGSRWRAVVEYLDRVDPDAARAARRAYGLLRPLHGDAQEYARATALTPTSCEADVVADARDAARERARLSRRRTRGVLRRRAERAGRDERGALLPRDGPRRAGSRGTCATITWWRRSTG